MALLGADPPESREAGPDAKPELSPRERALRRCGRTIDRHFRRFQLDPETIQREEVCALYATKAEARTPPSELARWLTNRIHEAQFHWARPGARHRPGARYRHPFVAWIPRLLSQASGGQTHDTPAEYHAFDFLMPSGTLVLAAREGRVVFVADGVGEDVPWRKTAGNAVTILHDDGTWASYAHLQAGISVRVGEHVKRGEPIGRSGRTGYAFTPHLHLVVQRMDEQGEVKAVPIRWGKPGGPGVVLEAGRHVGFIPTPRQALRVYVEGRPEPLARDTPRPVAYGAELRLRVERVETDGSTTDVTDDARTRYETMTVWNLHAPVAGVVRISPVPGIEAEFIEKALPVLDQSEALLFVYHGRPRDRDFGLAQVAFRVQVGAPTRQPLPSRAGG